MWRNVVAQCKAVRVATIMKNSSRPGKAEPAPHLHASQGAASNGVQRCHSVLSVRIVAGLVQPAGHGRAEMQALPVACQPHMAHHEEGQLGKLHMWAAVCILLSTASTGALLSMS